MNIEQMFTTPFGWTYLDGIDNEALIGLCYQKLKERTDNQTNTLDFSSYPLKSLADKVLDNVNLMHKRCGLKFTQKISNVWCNYKNAYRPCKPHTHANSFFVGIYYLNNSDIKLNLINPIGNIENLISPDIVDQYNPFNQLEKYIYPEKGLLVVHPAWILHYVDNIPDERMSIAFDFIIDKGD